MSEISRLPVTGLVAQRGTVTTTGTRPRAIRASSFEDAAGGAVQLTVPLPCRAPVFRPTAFRLLLSDFSSSARDSSVTSASVELAPIRPMRQILPAKRPRPAPISMLKCCEQVPAHRSFVDAVRHAHGVQRPQPFARRRQQRRAPASSSAGGERRDDAARAAPIAPQPSSSTTISASRSA